MYRRQKLLGNAGFTLAEMMLVLALIGVLASATASNMLPQLPRYRLQRASAQLVWHLRALRLQAVSQQYPITVTFTNDHVYTVFRDKNRNGAADADETQTTDIQAAYSGVTVASTNNPIFTPTGIVNNLAAITLTGAGSIRTISMTAAGGITLN